MNKIGSLYQVKEFHWLLFLSKETADRLGLLSRAGRRRLASSWRSGGPLVVFGDTTARTADLAAAIAAMYSKQLNCNVSYISPKDILVLVGLDKKHRKVLTTKGELGWIFIDDYEEFFEEVSK